VLGFETSGITRMPYTTMACTSWPQIRVGNSRVRGAGGYGTHLGEVFDVKCHAPARLDVCRPKLVSSSNNISLSAREVTTLVCQLEKSQH
jgi:hypothetical protein